MRHRKAGKKLGRNPSHRKALLRNMVTSLFKYEQIETTVAKAKSVRPVAEKMITLAKQGDLHARRQALAYIKDKQVTHRLFDELKDRYVGRQGGIIRIVKKGSRKGDGAPMSIIQLLPQDEEKKSARKKTKKPGVRKSKEKQSDKKVAIDKKEKQGGKETAGEDTEKKTTKKKREKAVQKDSEQAAQRASEQAAQRASEQGAQKASEQGAQKVSEQGAQKVSEQKSVKVSKKTPKKMGDPAAKANQDKAALQGKADPEVENEQ